MFSSWVVLRLGSIGIFCLSASFIVRLACWSSPLLKPFPLRCLLVFLCIVAFGWLMWLLFSFVGFSAGSGVFCADSSVS